MKTTIYYFTGTGNSLAFARQLQERFDDCAIKSISNHLRAESAPAPDTTPQTVGIVCPIYMHGMPHIISRFIRTLHKADYLFLVYAGGGDLGRGVSDAARTFSAHGLTLSAIFNVAFPSNYTPYGAPDAVRIDELLGATDSEADRVAELVRSRATHRDSAGTSLFAANLFPGLLYRLGHRFIPSMDGRFEVEDQCTKCGLCSSVCPVNNISLEDGYPRWNHQCEQCFACLQWCPVQAIQYGKRTRGVPRYHHPNVSVRDIITDEDDSSGAGALR